MIGTKKALELCAKHEIHITPDTMRNWCNKYGIGFKRGGRFYIDENALNLIIKGQQWQLEEVLKGKAKKK